MSRNFYTPINLNGLELQGAVVGNLSTTSINALSAVAGRLQYDSTLNVLKYRDNTGWQTISTGGGSFTLGSTTISLGGTSGVSGTPITGLYVSGLNLAGTTTIPAFNVAGVITNNSSGVLSSATDITAYVAAGTTAAAGKLQLTDSTSSTSTNTAATPNSVKTAYDLANAALPKSGGTLTGRLVLQTVSGSTAQLNFPSGGVPASPVTGDVWGTGTALSYYTGSATKTIAFTDSTMSGNTSGSAGSVANSLTFGSNLVASAGASPWNGSAAATIALSATPTSLTSINGISIASSGAGSTGTFLTSTSTASALTSVGTLTSLTLGGTLSMGSNNITGTGTISATTFTGALGATSTIANGVTATTQPALDNSTKVATTAYVDSAVTLAQQGFNVHMGVSVATTANLAGTYTAGTVLGADGGYGYNSYFKFTATGAQTVDSYVLALGDRILVKNQTTQTQNGIYVVVSDGIGGYTAGTGTGYPASDSTHVILLRTSDYDNSTQGEVFEGDLIYVGSGGQIGTIWVMNALGTSTTPHDGIKIGTDNITFAQFMGVNNGVTSLTGTTNQVSVSASTGAVTVSLPSAVTISGAFTAGSLVKSGGTSSQFLKADGSTDSSTYLTSSTGVTTVNGSSGAITNVALTNANNNFSVGQTVTGTLTATSLVKSGGTSTQFLKADGSVDSSTYLTSSTGVTTVNGSSGAITSIATTNANTFTGTQTIQAASTQDAVKVAGRAGGTSSYAVTLTPTTLTANQTLTLPNTTATLAAKVTGSITLVANVSNTITHNLNTQAVVTQIFDSSWNIVEMDVTNTSSTVVTLLSQVAGTYNYVIIG